jgi:hypothetical protein
MAAAQENKRWPRSRRRRCSSFASDCRAPAEITGCRIVAAHSGVSPYKGNENEWKSGPHGPYEKKATFDAGWKTGWYEVVPDTNGGAPAVVEKNSLYKPKY